MVVRHLITLTEGIDRTAFDFKGETGWLVSPEDTETLADAITTRLQSNEVCNRVE